MRELSAPVRAAQRCVEATIRLREMFRTTGLGWRGLPALRSLTLELGPDGEARTIGEQARAGPSLGCEWRQVPATALQRVLCRCDRMASVWGAEQAPMC